MNKSKSTFKGGYYFRKFQGTPSTVLAEAPIPSIVRFSVTPNSQILIKEGDIIEAGQKIAENPVIISSVYGKVSTISPYIEIKAENKNGFLTLQRKKTNWEELSCDELWTQLKESGILNLGLLEKDSIKAVVVSAFNTHPCALNVQGWIQNKMDALVTGIKILSKVYPEVPIYIACSTKDKSFYNDLLVETSSISKLEVHALKPKYPQELGEILVETLTGNIIPDGKEIADLGYCFLNIEEFIYIYESIVDNKPFIEKIISLEGTGYKQNQALKVRLGTPLLEIYEKYRIENSETRMLDGNALTGNIVNHQSFVTAKTRTTTCIKEDRKRRFLFFLRPGLRDDSLSRTFLSYFLPVAHSVNTNIHGEERPSVQCGYCESVCPRHLLPNLMHRYCSHDMEDEAIAIRMHACINCKLCSYVCPSKITKAFRKDRD
jgi:Na(+)-translocating NADH:ubiquinone oxidoreductase A subunit